MLSSLPPDGDRHSDDTTADITTRLPFEILREIFLKGNDSERMQPLLDSVGYSDFTTTVSHVCSRWRKVSLGDPRLWANLHFTIGGPLAKQAVRLERSKHSPLYIFIEGCLDDFMDTKEVFALHCMEIWGCIFRHADRWKELTVCFDGCPWNNIPPQLWIFFTGVDRVAFPTLSAFTISVLSNYDDDPPAIINPLTTRCILGKGAPSLSNARLEGIAIGLTNFYDFLAASPNLERLCMQSCIIMPDEIDGLGRPPAMMTRLKRIGLHDRYTYTMIASVILCIQAPRLESLGIMMQKSLTEGADVAFTALVDPSHYLTVGAIRGLSLIGISSVDHALLERLLWNLTSLECIQTDTLLDVGMRLIQILSMPQGQAPHRMQLLTTTPVDFPLPCLRLKEFHVLALTQPKHYTWLTRLVEARIAANLPLGLVQLAGFGFVNPTTELLREHEPRRGSNPLLEM